MSGVYELGQAIVENVSSIWQSNNYNKGIDPISACVRLAALKIQTCRNKARDLKDHLLNLMSQ